MLEFTKRMLCPTAWPSYNRRSWELEVGFANTMNEPAAVNEARSRKHKARSGKLEAGSGKLEAGS